MKYANSIRGEVAFPEAGPDARLSYSVDAMERFYSELGSGYREKVIQQLVAEEPPSFLRDATETMMIDMTEGVFPFGLTNDEIRNRLLDAMSLAMNGTTAEVARELAEKQLKEQEEKLIAEREEKIKKKLAMMDSKDPTTILASILADPMTLSTLLMNAGSDQVSESPKSDDTPSTTSSDSTNT